MMLNLFPLNAARGIESIPFSLRNLRNVTWQPDFAHPRRWTALHVVRTKRTVPDSLSLLSSLWIISHCFNVSLAVSAIPN